MPRGRALLSLLRTDLATGKDGVVRKVNLKADLEQWTIIRALMIVEGMAKASLRFCDGSSTRSLLLG